MYTVGVIPLHKNPFTTDLSYFSKDEYEVGTLVTVPIKNRETMAMVLSCEPVSTTKTALRMASFSLRKLPIQDHISVVPRTLRKLARQLQTEYPASFGLILHSLLPIDIKHGAVTFPEYKETNKTNAGEVQLFQAPAQDRYIRYQSIIRTTFAQNKSVVLVVPTAAYVPEVYEKLSHGIEKHVMCLSPHISKSKRVTAYKKIYTSPHPILIITTPQYAYLERSDTQTIILERSGSSNWIERTRPYLDHSKVLQHLCLQTGRVCILGDVLPRTEDEYACREEIISALEEPPKRLALKAKFRTIKEEHKPTKEEPFKLFFDETVKRIQTVLNRQENVFFYAARRGLAPLIVCFDCGTIVKSPESGAPYSLLRTQKNGTEYRWFVDRNSGKRTRAADTCENCGSWRLQERGIGIQHIQDACAKYFPNTPVICFDNTTADTPKKANELQKQMQTARGSIFLGTISALPYLPEQITTTCITSMEATQSIPSWRADEMLLRLLLELREKSSLEVIAQTRSEPPEILNYATQGQVEKFYSEELSLREMLNYPPFSWLILLTWQESAGSDPKASTEELLKNKLTDYQGQYYTSPLSTTQKYIRHCLLRIPKNRWPDQNLRRIFSELPPYIKIQLNPDRII